MQLFKADLHIHTLLSPCGSLEMSPANIINSALKKQLTIIGITDHNSTKQAPLIKQLAHDRGLFVLCGAEINSKEEVHCLVFFENLKQLAIFQDYIDKHLIRIKNNPGIFGEQIVVDKNEMIIEQVESLLINALDTELVSIERYAHQLGGIVIPAHIDRYSNGLFSQLGFIPPGLTIDGLEISANTSIQQWKNNPLVPPNTSFIQSSDAHIPDQIGKVSTLFKIEYPAFNEIKMALHGIQNRKTILEE